VRFSDPSGRNLLLVTAIRIPHREHLGCSSTLMGITVDRLNTLHLFRTI
jgi:hypothetical protein